MCTDGSHRAGRTEEEVVPMAAMLATTHRFATPCARTISFYLSVSGNQPVAHGDEREWSRPGAAMM